MNLRVEQRIIEGTRSTPLRVAGDPTSQRLRWTTIGVLVVLVTAPVAFFLFVMGLVVHEAVIWPTAAFASAVVASLAASWTADGLAGDGKRTAISEVARRNLAWALIPAGLVLLAAFVGGGLQPAVWIGFTVVYTSTVGVILASRHRTDDPEQSRKGVAAVLWLMGTGLSVAAVIFIASLFGFTGA